MRGALSAGSHVHVRIGAIGNESVAMRDHRLRHVGMQVEAGDNGNARAHQAAHARQKLAFAVVEVLGHHRAVQVEIDSVDRTRRLEAC